MSLLIFEVVGIDELNRKADTIIHLLRILVMQERRMSQEMDDLIAAVTEETNATTAAVKAFQDLAQQFTAAAGNSAKVKELAATLHANASALAAAIPANTPAAPPSA